MEKTNMRIIAAAIAMLLTVTVAVPAQEKLLPTGEEGFKKRSWVLVDSAVTVRGERKVEVPANLFEGKSLSYVAFFVDDKLIAIDEIPPFEITHDFGNYTHKAEIVAIGVKYERVKSEIIVAKVPTTGPTDSGEPQETATEGSDQAETADVSADEAVSETPKAVVKPAVKLISPDDQAYATGFLTLKAETNLKVEDVLRVDFVVDGATIGSVEAPPYELEHDFGRSFNARNVVAKAILRDGSELQDGIRTQPLEGSDYFVRTRLVTLEATVLDWRDRLVGDLKQDEFKIFENGVEQDVTHFAVEERPIRVAILLDASGSMSQQRRITMAVQSAKQFLDFLKPEQDKVALIAFTDVVNKLSGFTNDFDKIKAILNKVEADGGTAINDTLNAVAPLFEDEPGRKAVVLITDGYDEHSNVSVNDAVEKVRRAGVKIYSIGIFDQSYYSREMQEAIGEKRPTRGNVPDVDPTDARKRRNPYQKGADTRTVVFEGLSDETGGASFFPKTVNELPQIFTRIANELRRMYSLGYIPKNNEPDGKWRELKVETKRGGTHVRAKRGYYAEK